MTDPRRDAEAGQRRLEDALGLWLSHVEGTSGSRSADDLLASNPELRDLLEPLLEPATKDSSNAPPLHAATLADFRIDRELGRGGMGIVYAAEQLALRRTVALKLLPPAFADSPSAILRFRHEAMAAAALEHPNIVKVFSIGEGQGTVFQAMEFIDGPTLAIALERLRGGNEPDSTRRVSCFDGMSLWRALQSPLPPPSAWPKDYLRACTTLVAAIADALSHAHARGIVHRDVKPGNILLRMTGVPMLSDFGLARLMDRPGISDTGAITGTPCYLAPEQILSGKTADSRADVFALGATLYEMLALERPFAGESTAEVLHAITNREPRNVQERNRSIDRDLAAIVHKALAKNPDDRYQSVGDLARDLRAWSDLLPISARPVTALSRSVRWARRERLKAGLLLGLVVAVPTAIFYGLSWSTSERERETGKAMLMSVQVDETLSDAFSELNEGLGERAQALLQAALALEPKCQEAKAGLALLALRTHGKPAAIAVIDSFAPASNETGLIRLKATWLRELGQEEAAKILDAGLPQSLPERSAVDLFIGAELELARGHRGDRDAYPRAAELFSRAVHASSRAKALYWFELAHAAGHANDARRVEDAEIAIAANWKESARGVFWIGFGNENLDRAKAGRMMALAVEKRPDWSIAWFNYGTWLLRDGKLEAGVLALEKSVHLQPTWDLPIMKLTEGLLRAGEPKKALELAKKQVEATPGTARAQALLARAFLDLGDSAGAKTHADAALALHGSEIDALAVRGRLHANRGDLGAACEDFEAALRLDPAYAAGWHQLGYVRMRQGRTQDAQLAYERAIAADPAYGDSRVNLAQILITQKEFVAAESHIESAIASRRTRTPASIAKLRLVRDRDGEAAALAFVRTWAAEADADAEAHLQLARMLLEAMTKEPEDQQSPKRAELLKEARSSAEQAVAKTAMKSGPALWALGEAQLCANELEAAKLTLQSAKEALVGGEPVNGYYRTMVERALTRVNRELARKKR